MTSVKSRKTIKISFDKFLSRIAKITGKSFTFITALILVVAWAITGPLFHFSNTWQLAINTGTSTITFLMVFIIQQAQNKDTLAIQLKLNELIAATEGASNKALNIEDLTDEELRVLKKFYGKLSKLPENKESLGSVASAKMQKH